MRTFLKFVIHLSLIVWIGGIIFFSAVVAPSVFSVLMPMAGGQHAAGDIVNRSLNALHWMGLTCGGAFLLSSSVLNSSFRGVRHYLVVAMLSLTLVSLFWVTPQLIKLRQFNPDMQSAPAAVYAEFDYLHSLSVGLEGTVLFLGIVVVWLVAKEQQKH